MIFTNQNVFYPDDIVVAPVLGIIHELRVIDMEVTEKGEWIYHCRGVDNGRDHYIVAKFLEEF